MPAAIEHLENRTLLSADLTAQLLRDVNFGQPSSNPREFVEVDGTLYFMADGPDGRELWKSDGTAAGTTLVKNVGFANSSDSNLANVNGTLFFSAIGPPDPLTGVSATGLELWKSDG